MTVSFRFAPSSDVSTKVKFWIFFDVFLHFLKFLPHFQFLVSPRITTASLSVDANIFQKKIFSPNLTQTYPSELGFSDFKNFKFSRQITSSRTFVKKIFFFTQPHPNQPKWVGFLGFQKFQVFSPNHIDANNFWKKKIFRKLICIG